MTLAVFVQRNAPKRSRAATENVAPAREGRQIAAAAVLVDPLVWIAGMEAGKALEIECRGNT